MATSRSFSGHEAMIDEPDASNSRHSDAAGATDQGGIPADWKEAIPCLISSRIAIIQAEFKQALGATISKLVMVFVGLIFLMLGWLMLLGGIVGLIAESSGLKWYAVSFFAAGLHVLAAIVVLILLRLKQTEKVFPVTKAEFEKDVEWLSELKRK